MFQLKFMGVELARWDRVTMLSSDHFGDHVYGAIPIPAQGLPASSDFDDQQNDAILPAKYDNSTKKSGKIPGKMYERRSDSANLRVESADELPLDLGSMPVADKLFPLFLQDSL